MSTVIPIQDLDPSISPPNNKTIRAVVTLSWPYSSSTRQCALLLSERDFRLRARGGQIRVKFSGPAARAVAQAKLGISDEIVLELGGGEWASGAPVHVPGKSVGEIHFGQGIRLKVQKEGSDDVEINVAEDAVDEIEEETSQVEVTPAKKTSPKSTFRSSIGTPGSAAIYSSPAYMRKAAKFSYLDGISRLFEDEWDNQDLPRKKARTSIGEVRSWKVVDRTPSPERPSPAETGPVEEEMPDADQNGDVEAEKMVADDLPVETSARSQESRVEMDFVRSSPTPAPIQQDVQPTTFVDNSNKLSSPLDMLAAEALRGQDLGDVQEITAPAFPRLSLPPDSPAPQSNDKESEQDTVDPTTPRLLPISSAVLPSTTPQISPLVTKDALSSEAHKDREEDIETTSQVDLPSDVPNQGGTLLLSSPNKATENLLDQLRSMAGESELATEPAIPEHEDTIEVLSQTEADDLAEEDSFSDDEGEDALSAHERDDDLMPEDDAEDVFDADEVEGEEPSDDDTNEDLDMYNVPAQKTSEETTAEQDHEIGGQPPARDQTDSNISMTSTRLTDDRATSQQSGFAPASTLLHAAETPFKSTERTLETEEQTKTTPPKQPFFGLDGAMSTTESPEMATPAAKPTSTPKSTPQSARDKVMKRTFHSLFGIKGTPSPEKEDVSMVDHTASAEQDDVQQADIMEPTAMAVEENLLEDAYRSGLAQTGDAPKVAAVEPFMTENSSLKNQEEILDVAEPPELQSVTPAENDLLGNISPEYQQEGMQAEAPHTSQTTSPELINLDSSSDEDSNEPAEELKATQVPPKFTNPAPVPQKRAAPQVPELDTYGVPDAGHEEITETFDGNTVVEDPMTLDSNPSNAVKQGDQHDLTEFIQSPPAVDPQKDDQQSLRDAEGIVKEQFDATGSVEVVSQPEELISQSFDQPPDQTTSPGSPVRDVERPTPVDIEPLEQIQSELMDQTTIPDSDDTLMNDGNALEERIRQPQPSASPEELEEQTMEATTEEPTTGQKDVEIVASLNENENDVEMPDDERQDHESSQVSIQSQTMQDSIDAQRPELLERSSRPTSRDTMEKFSPMVLGSMSQRITDLVSEESATARLQELQSQDVVEIDDTVREALEVPQVATFVEEDMLDQTPTRSARVDLADNASPWSELNTLSPVAFAHDKQQQEPTPQATLDDSRQTLAEPHEEVTAVPGSPETREDVSTSDAQLLESQFQVAEVMDEQNQQLRSTILSGLNEQIDHSETTVGKDEVAHLPLPPSPSATQLAEPQEQLSHASITRTAMQPTPATSQFHSSAQPQIDVDAAEASAAHANMPQAQSQEQESASMPPPEQGPPPKTPARKSLRSRLSNVPDVISAWFSPKRSSIAAQEKEVTADVETPAKVEVQVTEKTRTPRRRASGVSTAHAYFTSLASLDQHVNASSQRAGSVDILAVVSDFTKEPVRAKGGPKDYYTIFRVTDTSMPSAKSVRVEVYRPWKAVLPVAEVGDVVLLRAFVVKSKKRQAYLLSTDASAWCVWRFAEHSQAIARGSAGARDGESPAWARRMSHGDVREEVHGPPVEYGTAEKEQARKLRNWWIATHGEAEVGATERASGEEREEAAEVIEL